MRSRGPFTLFKVGVLVALVIAQYLFGIAEDLLSAFNRWLYRTEKSLDRKWSP